MLTWIDLEMTGLDPSRDHILEIASLITTDNLEIIAIGPEIVIHHPEDHLKIMKEPVISMHQKNGLTEEVRKSKVTLAEAEEETLDFIKQNIPQPYSSPICGNTIWMDRNFLKAHMPSISKHLHYRCLDVSTIKELAKRWLGDKMFTTLPRKSDAHRAAEDIKCSVEELTYYRDNFFNLSPESAPKAVPKAVPKSPENEM